jgi:hypothetical protein
MVKKAAQPDNLVKDVPAKLSCRRKMAFHGKRCYTEPGFEPTV